MRYVESIDIIVFKKGLFQVTIPIFGYIITTYYNYKENSVEFSSFSYNSNRLLSIK